MAGPMHLVVFLRCIHTGFCLEMIDCANHLFTTSNRNMVCLQLLLCFAAQSGGGSRQAPLNGIAKVHGE